MNNAALHVVFSRWKPQHLKLLSEAVALQQAEKLDKAKGIYVRLLTFYPKDTNVLSLLRMVYDSQGHFEDSIKVLEKLIAANPQPADSASYADAYNQYGMALHKHAKYPEATASFDKAIAANPAHALARLNKGLIKLMSGEYEEGWQLYESRWQHMDAEWYKKHFGSIRAAASEKPLWSGKESLEGKTILLYQEQGLGDTMQFCRYIPMVQVQGATLVLAVRFALAQLMQTLGVPFHLITDRDNTLPAFDLQCPLMSLPLAFGTTLTTIPNHVPYLFVDPGKRELWQKRLGQKARARVGLAWSGALDNPNDAHRSIPLDLLTPLLQCDADFHALQKEIRPADAAFLAGGGKIKWYPDDLQDFTDTAALAAEMDLIISIDTSVAHLAGALGKPLWVLLPLVPDFRWLLDRQDSPWYPTARLFRQQTLGDWAGVMEKVKTELAAFKA